MGDLLSQTFLRYGNEGGTLRVSIYQHKYPIAASFMDKSIMKSMETWKPHNLLGMGRGSNSYVGAP